MPKVAMFCCVWLWLSCQLPEVAFGQNLVPNGDFEKYNNCPTMPSGLDYSPNYSSFPTVMDWVSAIPSCDYFNRCAYPWVGFSVPSNNMGYQEPHSGNGYSGFFSGYSDNGGRSCETVATRLSQSLQKDSAYCVSFFVSSSYLSTFGGNEAWIINEIGASFTDTQMHSDRKYFLDIPYHIQNDTNRRLTDTSIWYNIRGVYFAKGGEQWLTIGTFGDSAHIPAHTFVAKGSGGYFIGGGYIYLDDVSVIPTPQKITVHDTTSCVAIYSQLLLTSSASSGPYQWNNGAKTRSIRVGHTGQYVCHAIKDCEVVTDIYNLDSILATASWDTSICQDVIAPKISLLDTNIIWYSSINGSGSINQPIINTLSPAKQVIYVAKRKGACVSEKTPITITIIGKPKSHETETIARCIEADNQVQLNIGRPPEANTHYYWSNGDTISSISPQADGIYIRTAVNECGNSKDTIHVYSDPCERCAIFPDAFTPNRDGINDNFSALIRCPVKDFYMRIYNRWGQVMYSANNPNEHWKGDYGNALAPTGTYMYFASFTHTLTNKMMVVKGEVTLIR